MRNVKTDPDVKVYVQRLPGCSEILESDVLRWQ